MEGLGVVSPYLNIDAKGTAVKIAQNSDPVAFFAPNGPTGIQNAGLASTGGFSDLVSRNAGQAHLYTFSFAPGVAVTNFSLHMLDYGDWNYAMTTYHYVSMTAYNAANAVVSKQELSFTTPTDAVPRNSNLYGDPYINGDAISAPLGQPGNFIWHVSGPGITRVVLEFGAGYEPNIGLDLLSFTTECPGCQSVFNADFSQVAAGQSVEGLGVVAPDLNIDAKGLAIKIAQATSPDVYYAPNGPTGIMNGGLVANGGFSDRETRTLRQPHQYTFSFTPGMTITNFSLHMLDYGDWNYPQTTSHYASMTAYNAAGGIVSKHELSFTTNTDAAPRNSNLYGDLYFNGDGASASLGQPGNWIWDVSGNGITRVVLDFGTGYDPNLALDLLSYTSTVCK